MSDFEELSDLRETLKLSLQLNTLLTNYINSIIFNKSQSPQVIQVQVNTDDEKIKVEGHNYNHDHDGELLEIEELRKLLDFKVSLLFPPETFDDPISSLELDFNEPPDSPTTDPVNNIDVKTTSTIKAKPKASRRIKKGRKTVAGRGRGRPKKLNSINIKMSEPKCELKLEEQAITYPDQVEVQQQSAAELDLQSQSQLHYDPETIEKFLENIFNYPNNQLDKDNELNPLIDNDGEIVQKKEWPCTECKNIYDCERSLMIHSRVHRSGSLNKCPFCTETFSQKRKLISHLSHKHNISKSGHLKPPNKCKPRRNSKNMLSNESDSNEIKCNECSKTFAEKASLKRHMVLHEGEKKYLCSDCGAAFFRSDHLKAHVRFHTGERPYKCTQCSASFTRSGALKQHKSVHTKEKLYICHQCGNSYKLNSSLQEHLKNHRGIYRRKITKKVD